MSDPYTILGVSSAASDEEISKAYKKLARQYHPDLNPGNAAAEAKMKEINMAYEAIRDIRSGKKVYGDTNSFNGGYRHDYRTYESTGTGSDPFEAYRKAYGARYYGFDFSDLFGRRSNGEKQSSGSFVFFDIFRSFIKISIIMTLLRFVFSMLFYPVF